MLTLFLMRHADALPVGGPIARDYDRPLSPRGHDQVDRLATALRERRAGMEAVVSSPLVRAVQTARRLAGHFSISDIQTSSLLAPRGMPPAVGSLLERPPSVTGLLLVGHQPDLSLLAASLSGSDVAFSTGDLAAFQWDPLRRKAAYLWSLSPGKL